jgi:hypothetical protein
MQVPTRQLAWPFGGIRPLSAMGFRATQQRDVTASRELKARGKLNSERCRGDRPIVLTLFIQSVTLVTLHLVLEQLTG